MTSKSETIMKALEALFKAITDVDVKRNANVPEKVEKDGLIILRDGEAEEIDALLGSDGPYVFALDVDIELFVKEVRPEDREAKFDALAVKAGAALDADNTLGGLADGLTYQPPAGDIEGFDGGAQFKAGILPLRIEYQSATRI